MMSLRLCLLGWLFPTTVLAAAGAEVVKANRPSPTAEQQLLVIEHNVIIKTNAERSRYGLAPLSIDMSLVGSARQHAAWMARNRRMQHGRAFVAENIAMGQNSSSEVLQSWMSSSGHRANILNPGHRRIGAACYRALDGRIYWCQQFLQ
jgi:uncharacterized protein YkwD